MPVWLEIFFLSLLPAGAFLWNLREGQGVLGLLLPIADRKNNPRWFWAVQSFWGALFFLVFIVGLGELFGIFPL